MQDFLIFPWCVLLLVRVFFFFFFPLHRHCCNTFAEIQSQCDPLVPIASGERRLPVWFNFLIPGP